MDHPTRYQVTVRVRGELAPAWSPVFEGVAVTPGARGTTLLRGELPDQAAVHGLLAAIRDLGLALVSAEVRAAPERHGHP
jgi:hypothetical protein